MSGLERLRSAGRELGGIHAVEYSIFERAENTKAVLLWQPRGTVRKGDSLPSLDGQMRQKAEEFLNRAIESETHLAAAPEWAYDINWVEDHVDYLFAEDSPLFVLGCTPIRDHEREDFIDALEPEFEVCEAGDVDCDSDEFLTPTIIPIKAAARRDSDTDAILIQYKNQPMSAGILNDEQADLALGTQVWKVDPRDRPTVIVWTCSDIMDNDLYQEVQQLSRRNDSFIVHVQCNPAPFYDTWVNFRNQVFDGGDHRVSYICANWGEITLDGKKNEMGYSGVYAKARKRSPFTRYETTYRNGGLVGTKPSCRCDFVWLMQKDIVSQVRFKQLDPGTTGAGTSPFSLPRISETWVWDSDIETYADETPGVPECTEDPCNDWKSKLPDSPLGREISTAIALGKIDFDQLQSDNFDPQQHMTWAAVESLTDLHGTEQLGHALVAHPHQADPKADEEAEQLLRALETANDHDIRIDDEFELAEAPMNAKYETRAIEVCLVVVREIGDASEKRGEAQVSKWVDRREDKRFKPIVVTPDVDDGLVLKTLENYEDVSRVDHDTEDVTTAGGLVRIDQ
jgi:hypothetical protein